MLEKKRPKFVCSVVLFGVFYVDSCRSSGIGFGDLERLKNSPEVLHVVANVLELLEGSSLTLRERIETLLRLRGVLVRQSRCVVLCLLTAKVFDHFNSEDHLR